jgi:hypothetical protein
MMDLETQYQSSFNPTDRSSKSLSSNQQLQELFDFSLNIIPGLYKCLPETLSFEICEENMIARAEVSLTNPHLHYKVSISQFQEFSISYYCTISFNHSDCVTSVKLPYFRSYNPSGNFEYLTQSNFLFLAKFASVLCKSAISGACQEDLKYLKNSIKQLPSYKNNKTMIDYFYVQVIQACYLKVSPPSFPEYICGQIMKGGLMPRPDTKEYLEQYLMFIKGEVSELKVPAAYFSALLKFEKNLSWEVKNRFIEEEGKANKTSKILKNLPLLLEELDYVEIGMPYQDLNDEIMKLADEFEKSIDRFNECIFM